MLKMNRLAGVNYPDRAPPTAHPFDHKLHSHLLCSMKRSQKPENHNPKLQSMRATPAPVTLTGMPGHNAGIAGHDHRNTQTVTRRWMANVWRSVFQLSLMPWALSCKRSVCTK